MAGTARLAAAAATKLIAREPPDGCGYCRRTLGADVRIECSVCTPRLLLCVECFHAGVVIHTRGHTAEHGYRVIDVGREALLEVGWLAGDELKLLEAMQLYGFGNWADIASHVGGGRTRAEVESHYRRCYLESPNFPEPNFERLGHTPGKRMKLEAAAAPPSAHMLKAEDAARASAAAALAAAGGQAFVPGPNPAEVGARPPEAEYAYAGWMPLRGEFDTEWEDDAEVQTAVHEIEFTALERASVERGSPTPEAREKLQKLHAYNATLDGRQWRRQLVVKRELLDDIHAQVEAEKVAPVPEVARRARLRPFARFHSAAEHEDLVQSFLRQEALAQAVSQLQRGLVCGVRTMSQVDATLPPAALPPGAPRPAGLGKTATAGARKVAGSSRAARRAAAAEDTAAARGAAAAAVAAAEAAAQRRREAEALVSGAEAALCDELCLPAHAFARAKRTLILAAIPQGGTLGREAAVALLHPALDGARAAMVLAFCVKSGWIRQPAVAAALGTEANK